MLANSRSLIAAISALIMTTTGGAFAATSSTPPQISFDMVVSKGAAACLPKAEAEVKVISNGGAEDMFISATGLPPDTDFDFFVIQVPNGPFGLSWYQGDIETDGNGKGSREFIGRFSIETFIVAPNIAPAPADPFNEPGSIPDATQNPATNPVQTYHLGLWFNDPADVVKAGGPNTITPFNGEHNAGVQVLNTSEFPETSGPLEQVK